MEKEDKKKQVDDDLLDLSLKMIAIVFVVVLIGFFSWWRGYIKNLGEIGDFFGGILNPIVAFAALLWIMVGVRMQRSELKAAQQAIASQLEVSAVATLVQVELIGEADAQKRIQELEVELEIKSDQLSVLAKEFEKEIKIPFEKKKSHHYPLHLHGHLKAAEKKVNEVRDEIIIQKERIVELKKRRQTYAERLHKLAPGLADRS